MNNFSARIISAYTTSEKTAGSAMTREIFNGLRNNIIPFYSNDILMYNKRIAHSQNAKKDNSITGNNGTQQLAASSSIKKEMLVMPYIDLKQKYDTLVTQYNESQLEIEKLQQELISVYQNWISENFDALSKEAQKNDTYNRNAELVISPSDDWLNEDYWDVLYEEIEAHDDNR